jgi:RNA exonuclease 1
MLIKKTFVHSLQALMEEKIVYDRSSNKNIYLNVAVNMVKKLRDEISKSSDGSDQEMKSPTKNPNAMSHASVLGGARAAKTRFTMNRSGRIKVPEHLTGLCS